MKNATEPIVAAIAGTGGGKTVAGEWLLIMDMIANPNELWLVTEPTWEMVTRILLTSSAGRPSLLSLIKGFDPSAIYIKSDNAIYSKLGTVLFSSANRPFSMEGAHVMGWWADEAGQYSRLAFETGFRRVAFKGGRSRITTTPYNRGYLFKEIHQRALRGDPDYKVINFPSTANPAYSKAAFARAKRTMTDARFNMMHLGGFERPEGMIFSKYQDRMLIKPFKIPEEWWQGAAVDFGWNHPFGTLFGAKNPDGIYYITGEYKKAETLLADHAKALLGMTDNGINPEIWWADPSAKQDRAELRRKKIPLKAAINDVRNGIDTVNDLFASDRLRIFNTCTHLVDEIEGYVWKENKDNFQDEPVKIDDDLVDCLRYLVHSAEKQQRPQLFT
ncbi:MAG: hypothetical protein V3S68_04845 [Dehalococcoidia bacterium]